MPLTIKMVIRGYKIIISLMGVHRGGQERALAPLWAGQNIMFFNFSETN